MSKWILRKGPFTDVFWCGNRLLPGVRIDYLGKVTYRVTRVTPRVLLVPVCRGGRRLGHLEQYRLSAISVFAERAVAARMPR
jgi:hypothetical protein